SSDYMKFRFIIGLLMLLGVGAVAADGKKAPAARAPHTVSLIFYLSGANSQADTDAISSTVKKVKSVTSLSVNTDRTYALVSFDSHAGSYHQMAQAFIDAGDGIGKKYDPRLKITVPEYSQGKNAVGVDAVFAGKRLNQRVSVQPIDKTKGEFLVHFLPLKLDP